MMLQKLIVTNLFLKTHKALNTQCNSMERGRGHLIPLTSLEKSYLYSETAVCRLGIVLGLSNTDYFKKDHQSLSKGWRLH